MINNNGDISALIRRRLAGSRVPEDFSARRVQGDLPPEFMPKPPWKPAAVLIPVVERPEGHTLLFTERTQRLQDHAGQVSFPGGSREVRDRDPVETALRETEEEIGLARDHVQVVGFLGGYLTITGYAVTPVVGMVHPGFELHADPLEVAAVFEVPLAFLADPAHRETRHRELAGREVGYYLFQYQNHIIWGATAAMLVNFLDLLAVGSAPA